jgi:FkbM family methyltransferase
VGLADGWLILGIPLQLLPVVTRRLPRIAPTYVLLNALLRHYVGKKRPLMDAPVRGFNMRLDPSEFVDCALLFFPHLYDPDEIAFMSAHLRPGDVFLDVGAHIGLYALAASRLVGPDGLVLAIEPDPVSYERLLFHLRANSAGNVRALPIGVSDRREKLHLASVHSGNRAANTFLLGNADGPEVSCVPLLEIVRANGVRRIRGAKFDIEGFEYRTLARFFADAEPELFPEFLVVEFHPDWVDFVGGNVIDLLGAYGYRTRGTQALNYILSRDGMGVPRDFAASAAGAGRGGASR